MIPYYVLIFVPIVLASFKIKGWTKEVKPKKIITCFFLILLVLLVLRSPTVGRDLPNYKYIFMNNVKIGWKGIEDYLSEPAWFALNVLIGSITKDFQWLLVITAIITVLPLMYVYKKECEFSILTISLFITISNFIMLFSGLRQAISVSLGLIAFEFTKKRKFVPYLLVVILAFLFHKSAFMLLFMYPLYHAKITKKWLWFIVPVMSVTLVFNKPIFAALSLFISDLYEGSISNTGAYTMLFLFAMFCVYSFVFPDEEKLDENTIGMRNFLLLATVIQMFASLNSVAMRMGYYYIIFIPLLIPKIMKCSSYRWRQLIEISKYAMIVFFIAYFFLTAPATNSLDTFPYRFFWESNI